jgi:PPOX class probable F420-dependent enzyme
MDLTEAMEFAEANSRGVLTTLKRDGRPQLSNIFYVPDGGRTPVVRISVTDSRAKVANLRRDPRASLHVTRDDFFAWVVLDGTVELSDVAAGPDDAVVDELVAMYRTGVGEHPDWDEFRAAMVFEGRLVATFTAASAYGMLPS